jgi:hypothetical protein
MESGQATLKHLDIKKKAQNVPLTEGNVMCPYAWLTHMKHQTSEASGSK